MRAGGARGNRGAEPPSHRTGVSAIPVKAHLKRPAPPQDAAPADAGPIGAVVAWIGGKVAALFAPQTRSRSLAYLPTYTSISTSWSAPDAFSGGVGWSPDVLPSIDTAWLAVLDPVARFVVERRDAVAAGCSSVLGEADIAGVGPGAVSLTLTCLRSHRPAG